MTQNSRGVSGDWSFFISGLCANGIFGGSAGIIYRQFAATIVVAMALSVLIALTFYTRIMRVHIEKATT